MKAQSFMKKIIYKLLLLTPIASREFLFQESFLLKSLTKVNQ